ncbi:MAG: NAD(P)/FAD-dependent oxidoreductase, partial [Myxococcota bacterium]
MPGKSRGHRHQLVIVGGGFGGAACAKAALNDRIDVTVIERRSHQEFQPLLYQVATGAVSPDALRIPTRAVLPSGVRLIRDVVLRVDAVSQTVHTAEEALSYDSLVVAAGAFVETPKLFPEALPLKDVADAVTLRDHLFDQLTIAYDEHDETAATVVIVGGGPTGVELAGEIRRLALSELADSPLIPRVILVEQSDRLLPGFSRRASIAAEEALDRLGIEVRLEATIESTSPHRYEIRGTRGTATVDSGTLVWAAGVRPSALVDTLGPLDELGRVRVDSKCRVMDQPNVWAIGDAARFEGDDETLPWVAAVAMQQGAYVGRSIQRYQLGRRVAPFRYSDRGMIAHVGDRVAVGDVLGVPLEGIAPWLLAELVHLFFLPGIENRLLAATDFIASYLGRRRRPS